MKNSMYATEFFQKGKVGLKIRYGSPDAPLVSIFIFSKGAMYAWGEEEGTKRRIFLFLRGGFLVDKERGEFNALEVFPA
jgi:hypothetical protein